jgi:hypothetical protein
VSGPERSAAGPWATLGDFTATWRTVPISLIAITIGVLSGFVALALLELIGLFTNLFFFQRWDTAMVSPADHELGVLVIAVPVIGGLIIGVMARFGSEKIRGHGIPGRSSRSCCGAAGSSRRSRSSSRCRRRSRLARAVRSAPRARSS